MRLLLALLTLLAGCRIPRHSWSYQRLAVDSELGDLVAVSCDGSQRECYAGAAKACPAGFVVEDSQGQTRRGKASTVQYGYVSQTRVQTEYTGDMLIRCRP